MAGELLDFSVSSFVTFAECTSEVHRKLLTDSLNEIRENGTKVVLDFCALGQKLRDLRNNGLWRYVLDANGQRYGYDSFYEFCEDVLGFSKTKAQNMISLTEFVNVNGDTVKFIDDKYAAYNTSQLIELSSVSTFNRDLFPATMSVKDMRLVKSYMATTYSSSWTAETVLAEARKKAEQKERLKQQLKTEIEAANSALTEESSEEGTKENPVETVIRTYLMHWPFDVYGRKKIISSFIEKPFDMFPMFIRVIAAQGNYDRMVRGFNVKGAWWTPADNPNDKCILFTVQTSESVVEEKWNCDKVASVLRTLIKDGRYGFPFEYPNYDGSVSSTTMVQESAEDDENCAPDIVQGGDVDSDAEPEADEPTPEPQNYDLSSRDKRRDFLANYQSWTRNPNPTEFSFFAKEVYSVYLPELKLFIYALEFDWLTDNKFTIKDNVFYFMMNDDSNARIFVSKEILNVYIAERLAK